ncbi:MAG TPA: electron transfer flavoprotein subunit alpha, partial [Bdellovibrionota bacterium]|nr:electron transfer flavoprotein subunit alpha [Bdellovibrionota bacterium]
MSEILIFAEQRFGSLDETTPELITAARSFAEKKGAKVAVAILGKSIKGFADQLASLPVDLVISAEHDLLDQYTPDGYSKVATSLIRERKPEVILIAHTYQGMDLSPKIAAALNIGMASN